MNGQVLSPIFAKLILLLGVSCALKGFFGIILPRVTLILKQLLFKRMYLLNKKASSSNFEKWVIVLGATNHVGIECSKILFKHGYSLVLIDQSKEKL